MGGSRGPAVAALAPGSILWTDDLVFAEVAKSELGVEGVWTLALVEHLVNRGLIDRAVAEEAYAKLVGFNYQITHFRGSVIVAALRVSNGSVAAFPMRRMIQAFGPLAAAGAHRNTAFLMLAESTRFRPTPRPKRSWRKREFLGRN